MRDLFRGPLSLTYRRERLTLFITLIFAFPAAGAIGFVIHEEVGVSQVALFLVVAMIYVTLGRGRLVGTSVRIHEAQYPHVFAIVKRCAAALNLPMPMVFVREDYVTPVLAVGLGEPYSLIVSSNWIEHFQDDELAFMIGRELGHIASGHTRYTSLLSINGSENVIVSLVFGAWLRKTELTCDRIGLLCCGSLDSAIRAIAIASFHHFARKIDHAAFAEQHREMVSDPVFRLGEWLGSMPYATTRIDAMREFMASNLYALHEEHFVNESAAEPLHLPAAGEITVTKRDCAGWWRRFWAAAVDAIVVSSIVDIATLHLKAERFMYTLGVLHVNLPSTWPMPFTMFLFYSVLLVGLTGQTAGMLVSGLRVVRTDFGKPTILQALWRYIVAIGLCWLIVPLSAFSRAMLHDTFSGTRVIKTERVTARASAA